MTQVSQGWVGADVGVRMAAHVKAWEKVKPLGDKHRPETYPFVAISREFGCEALALAEQLVVTLNDRCRPSIPWVDYDRALLDRIAEEPEMQREILDMLDNKRRVAMGDLFDTIINQKVTDARSVRELAEIIRTLAVHGHAVLVGRGSSIVTQDLRNGMHIRLVAPREWRVNAIASNRNLSMKDAEKMVTEGEKQRHHYIDTYFVLDPQFPFPHDLVIDNSRFNLMQIVEIVFTALSARFGDTLVSA